mgnify:FL=1
MSISLIGIISVQLYWSKNAIDSKDVQFGGDVKKALARVSERLQIKEQDLYYNKIQNFIETKRFLNNPHSFAPNGRIRRQNLLI